ncbi:MAG: polyprenyl synthetase family protein [Tannerella sp.]|jgi:geranylgeranyl diphosphate synthase type II|nr:polyprenyl synthetase family protein [Tannerella sp.]
MLSLEQVSSIVETEIGKIYFDMSPRSLFEPIEYTLTLGGKRIRPIFTVLACNMYNEDIEDALFPAMGLEVFHNFTLLHDDLMDQADKRRNKLTVHKIWNANTAVLSGDAMLIASYRLLAKTSKPLLGNIMNLFTQTALEICCGQQYDMEFEKRSDVSEDEYMEMIRLKTAVLIACCLKTGAIVGGASENDAESLYRFGLNIGLAFQLQDDLLDVYGDADIFGKNIGGDILCDKKTFLLINATHLANEEQKSKLEFFRNPASAFNPEDKIRTFTEIYSQLNIKEITQNRMNNLYELALNELDSLEVSAESLSEIRKLSAMLMQRKS